MDLVGKSLIWSKRHGGVGETSRKKVLSPDSCAVFLGGKDFEVTVTKWEKVLFQAEPAENSWDQSRLPPRAYGDGGGMHCVVTQGEKHGG